MPDSQTTLERAIEIAESGECDSINAIRQRLRREDRLDVHAALSRPAVNTQLIAILRGLTSRAPARPAAPR